MGMKQKNYLNLGFGGLKKIIFSNSPIFKISANYLPSASELQKFFYITRTTFSHIISEQFSKQNIISTFFQRNMNEYFNAVKANEMITIFASLLHERRIIVTSSRLSRLTACVQAQYTLGSQDCIIGLMRKPLVNHRVWC